MRSTLFYKKIFIPGIVLSLVLCPLASHGSPLPCVTALAPPSLLEEVRLKIVVEEIKQSLDKDESDSSLRYVFLKFLETPGWERALPQVLVYLSKQDSKARNSVIALSDIVRYPSFYEEGKLLKEELTTIADGPSNSRFIARTILAVAEMPLPGLRGESEIVGQIKELQDIGWKGGIYDTRGMHAFNLAEAIAKTERRPRSYDLVFDGTRWNLFEQVVAGPQKYDPDDKEEIAARKFILSNEELSEGIKPYEALTQEFGYRAWKRFYEMFPNYAPSAKNRCLLKLKHAFGTDLQEYWPELLALGETASGLEGPLFEHALPAVRHLIRSRRDLHAVGGDLLKLGEAVGASANSLLSFGLPAVKTLIRNRKDLRAIGGGLMAMHHGYDPSMPTDFEDRLYDGLPKVQRLFGKDFAKYWPDIVALGRVSRRNAWHLFQNGLPKAKNMLGDDFIKYWPDLMALGMPAGERASYLFESLFEIKELFGEDFIAYWPDLVALGTVTGQKAETIFRWGVRAAIGAMEKDFIKGWADLSTLGKDLGDTQLNVLTVGAAMFSFGNTLATMKKEMGKDFARYFPAFANLVLKLISIDTSNDFTRIIDYAMHGAKQYRGDIREFTSRIPGIIRRYRALTKAGIGLYPAITNSDMTAAQIISRRDEIARGIAGAENRRPFDLNNPVDIILNFIVLRANHPHLTRLSYDNFISYVGQLKKRRKGADIPRENLIQLRALVFEAYQILELVDSMRRRSNRPIVVVANKSYGPYAIAPIRAILANMGVQILDTKMGSSTCHSNPYRISWDDNGESNVELFREDKVGAIDLFAKERPHVLFVDGSCSLNLSRVRWMNRQDARFPDAYQGVRNWFIALNEGIRNARASMDMRKDFQKEEGFLDELKGWPKLEVGEGYNWQGEFTALVTRIRALRVRVDGRALYHMRFWTPAGISLRFCEATQGAPHGDYRSDSPKLLDLEHDLDRPTVVMVESAMESNARYPKGVGAWINRGLLNDRSPPERGLNQGAFYDDQEHFNEFRFEFVPGTGVTMSLDYERTARELMEMELLTLVDKAGRYARYLNAPKVAQERKEIDGSVFDLTGTLASFHGKIPGPLADKINGLLTAGMKVAIVTDDTKAHDIDGRVVQQIDAKLRNNLSIYLNGGNTLWQFDNAGLKKIVYDNPMEGGLKKSVKASMRGTFQDMDVKRFRFDSHEYCVSVDLKEYIENTRANADTCRAQVIDRMEKSMAAKFHFPFRIFMAGPHHIKVHLRHKVEAVKDFLSRNRLSEYKLLIAGNECGSRKNDREMLNAFPRAHKINVGKPSPSLAARGTGAIYQIGVAHNRGMADMAKLLECFSGRQLNITKLAAYSRIMPLRIQKVGAERSVLPSRVNAEFLGERFEISL